MNKFWKGVIVGFLAACLLIVAAAALAKDPREILKGKLVVYVGNCAVDEKGMLPIVEDIKNKMLACSVGKDLAEPDEILWVLLNDERGAERIIRINVETNVQEVVWQRGRVEA